MKESYNKKLPVLLNSELKKRQWLISKHRFAFSLEEMEIYLKDSKGASPKRSKTAKTVRSPVLCAYNFNRNIQPMILNALEASTTVRSTQLPHCGTTLKQLQKQELQGENIQ
jgi:hypothetical protein